MKLIEQQWDSYREKVMPKQVSEVQLVETRRAFYAGAMAFISGFSGQLENWDHTSEPTESEMQAMSSMMEELEQFGRDVAAGKV